MTDNKNTRDILDVSSRAEDTPQKYPQENMPSTAARPSVSPQEGGYFLNKFLEKSDDENQETNPATEEPAEASVQSSSEQNGPLPENTEVLKENIVAALQEIYDPEIPVSIYELGLIYDVDVAEDFSVRVRMTLTTPHCPVAESMPGEVELKVAGLPGVKSSEVLLVWEPAWDMSMMSDEARLELGLL